MNKSTFAFLTILALSILSLSGCYPDDDVSIEELDIAFTHYDSDRNFADFKTFTLLDTIAHVVNGDTIVDHTYDSEILSSIRSNLLACGFTEKDSLGDVVVIASVLETDNYSVYYYPWGDYWGWYDWGGYWKKSSLVNSSSNYYPYYPYYSWGSPSVYYNYTTGTVSIQMTYPEGAVQNNNSVEIPVVWMGVINGVLNSGSDDGIMTRVSENINQCFEQSQYLKDGKN